MLSRTVAGLVPEGRLAAGLGRVQDDHPEVEVGSYPFFRDGRLGVSVVMRGFDGGALEAAAEDVRALIRAQDGTPLEGEPGLVELGFRSLRAFPEARSGSLCLEVPEGIPLAGLAKSLGERGVVVSTPDGFLRFAPHWPNASAEVPFVLEAVHDAVREIR